MPEMLVPNTLKTVMSDVPSPVCVVTYTSPDGPRGVTIGSFTSLSLAPPLISFNIMRKSQAASGLVAASHFRIHILKETQAALSKRFATSNLDSTAQFYDVHHMIDEFGIPKLEDALATLLCKRYGEMQAGDHILMIGEVTSIDDALGGRPLLYYNRTYHAVGEEVKAMVN